MSGSRRRLPWGRILFAVVVVGCIQLIANLFDPFGMEVAIKRHAGSVLQRVAAPLYPDMKSLPSDGQRRVTVVLIDREWFDVAHGGRIVWPLPVEELVGRILAPIVAARPAAVFVNLAFPDAPREIVAGGSATRAEAGMALADGLARLNGATAPVGAAPPAIPGARALTLPPIPIVLSDPFTPPLGAEACGRTYRAVRTAADSLWLSRDIAARLFGDPAHAPGIETADSNTIAPDGSYLLTTGRLGESGACAAQSLGRSDYVPSPALALYEAFGRACAAGSIDGAGCARAKAFVVPLRDGERDRTGLRSRAILAPAGDPVADQLAAALDDRVAIRWGARLTDEHAALMRSKPGADFCLDQARGGRLRAIRTYVREIVKPIRTLFEDSLRYPCPFIDTLSAADLDDARRFEAVGGVPRWTPDRINDTFLKGRIVLIAANIPQAGDLFDTPVNGHLPGVYLHASTVENLVTSGLGFAQAGGGWRRVILLFAVTLCAVVLMEATWHLLAVWTQRRLPAAGPLLVAPILYLGALLIVALPTFWLMIRAHVPLEEIAVPLVALHVILFAGWLNALRGWMEGHLAPALRSRVRTLARRRRRRRAGTPD